MIPKEFMTADMANELAVCVQRLNDLHTKMVILQRQIDEHAKMIDRQARALRRQAARWPIHEKKINQDAHQRH